MKSDRLVDRRRLDHFPRLTYAVRMSSTDFAPITLNGQPVRTLATGTTTYVEVGERFYVAEEVASEDCMCRRCAPYKQDFGGCIPAEAMWQLVCLMAGA